MSNEDKILEKIEDIQGDLATVHDQIVQMKGHDDNVRQPWTAEHRKEFFEALDNFKRVDSPEEQAEVDRFLAFMDSELERKRARYDLQP